MRPARSQFSPGQLMGLIIVGVLALALLCTPGAPLVVAILIVIPGFLLDRSRGGTGIVGGTISSPILAVILGIAYAYVSSEGSFSDFLTAGPAFYLIFVSSLLWGGIASTTLYWVIKSIRDRRSSTPERRHSRTQFTLGQLMGLILTCALVFAALSTPFAIFVLAIGIVVPGFLIDRFRGGAGIVGGMISAAMALVGLGIAVYAYEYFDPDPAMLDYLGPPILTLFMIGTAGAVWGALAGTLIDVMILIKKSYETQNPMVEDSSRLIVWLPDETSES